LRHRLSVLGVLAAAAAVSGLACGDDEAPSTQAVFWLALSPGQGASCSSNQTYTVPETARNTITSSDGVGARIVDSGADLVQCSVSPSTTAGSFDVSLRLSSGEIGNFIASGVLPATGSGQLDISLRTPEFSLKQDGCTATIEALNADGAVWVSNLSCPNLRDDNSPAIACNGTGGVIFENCD
jgi:hypothetical protein